MKAFECHRVMPACSEVIRGADEEEVMRKAAEHARAAHGMQNIPPDVRRRVWASIHDAS